nr:MAG TPA: hypothetical protein [Caudoviricetes sp.]
MSKVLETFPLGVQTTIITEVNYMIVKAELADGTTDIFETGNYKISNLKDFHPMICSVEIYSGTKRIKKISRRFKFFYKHFIFKSRKVQNNLAEIQKQQATAKKGEKYQED